MADTSQWMVIFRMLGSLTLVIGLIYGLSFLAKKYLRPERWGGKAEDYSAIRILQSFAFEPKKKLLVVEVNGKKLLLGVAEQSISFLTELGSEFSNLKREKHSEGHHESKFPA